MVILFGVGLFIVACLYEAFFNYTKARDDYNDCCHEELTGIMNDIYRVESEKLTEEQEAQKRLQQIYKQNAETVLKRTRTVAEKDGVRIAQEVVEYE